MKTTEDKDEPADSSGGSLDPAQVLQIRDEVEKCLSRELEKYRELLGVLLKCLAGVGVLLLGLLTLFGWTTWSDIRTQIGSSIEKNVQESLKIADEETGLVGRLNRLRNSALLATAQIERSRSFGSETLNGDPSGCSALLSAVESGVVSEDDTDSILFLIDGAHDVHEKINYEDRIVSRFCSKDGSESVRRMVRLAILRNFSGGALCSEARNLIAASGGAEDVRIEAIRYISRVGNVSDLDFLAGLTSPQLNTRFEREIFVCLARFPRYAEQTREAASVASRSNDDERRESLGRAFHSALGGARLSITRGARYPSLHEIQDPNGDVVAMLWGFVRACGRSDALDVYRRPLASGQVYLGGPRRGGARCICIKNVQSAYVGDLDDIELVNYSVVNGAEWGSGRWLFVMRDLISATMRMSDLDGLRMLMCIRDEFSGIASNMRFCATVSLQGQAALKVRHCRNGEERTVHAGDSRRLTLLGGEQIVLVFDGDESERWELLAGSGGSVVVHDIWIECFGLLHRVAE